MHKANDPGSLVLGGKEREKIGCSYKLEELDSMDHDGQAFLPNLEDAVPGRRGIE